MITQMVYHCPHCGCGYTLLHYAQTDEMLAKLSTLEQKCEGCGTLMKSAHNSFHDTPVMSIERNNIYFLGRRILEFNDGQLKLKMGELLHLGYSGILTIDNGNESLKYLLNPMEGSIKKIKASGSVI